jgi:hypothetical protein
MTKTSSYAKTRKDIHPELLGKKVKFNHRREGAIRGTIIETDKDTFVMATQRDPCLRWRLSYATLQNGSVEYL